MKEVQEGFNRIDILTEKIENVEKELKRVQKTR